jgi:hypothetical protein
MTSADLEPKEMADISAPPYENSAPLEDEVITDIHIEVCLLLSIFMIMFLNIFRQLKRRLRQELI